jgi:hypothetical protein
MNDSTDLTAYAAYAESEAKPDKLTAVTQLVVRMLELGQRIERGEKLLAELKQEYTRYNEQLVPTALADAQLRDMTLNTGKGNAFDGWYIGTETTVHGGIPKPLRLQAFDWLRKHKHAAIIKRKLSIEFGMGDEKFALRVLGYFKRWHAHRKFSDDETVHSSTLGAFVRDMVALENDENDPLPPDQRIPRDLFGVYERTVTIVTSPEE